jgi:hypothetical protein
LLTRHFSAASETTVSKADFGILRPSLNPNDGLIKLIQQKDGADHQEDLDNPEIQGRPSFTEEL